MSAAAATVEHQSLHRGATDLSCHRNAQKPSCSASLFGSIGTFICHFLAYIGGDLVQSIGRGKKLVRALAPAEVHAIYRNFIQLKG